MRENIYFYFMHTHVLFIFSLVLLLFNTTTTSSFGHQQLVAAAVGAAHTCIDKERQALLDFKAHLQDPDDMLYTWRPEEEDDCCKWDSVTCNNQTGHVTELRLNYYWVGGEITLSLVNLSYLSHLDLSYNSFNGTIGQFVVIIGNMTCLAYLDLSSNQFTGSIPKSIRHITQLTFLNLGHNQFIGNIPESLSSLTNLTFLDLSENNFSGTIPVSIGSLTELNNLLLEGNNFNGTIPRSIGFLTKLTYLDLSNNTFYGTIPRSIGFLTKLTYLDLSHNSFYGTIPPEFGNLTNLEYLYIGSLRSCIVENLNWLSSLSSLEVLYMDGISLAKANNWVNVVIGLEILEELSLRGCDLSQVMHPYSPSVNSSSMFKFFLKLHLDNNNLNSSMFHWLCPLIGTQSKTLAPLDWIYPVQLYLSGNKFDGKLSDFLNSLSGCTSATFEGLDASSNQLTWSLSDEIQNLSSLTYLNLSSNQLDGTISYKLWKLPNLQTLDLSSNSLGEALSNDDVSNISQSIQYIDFSSNKLGPRFPKWIQKLKNLKHLDLSNNSISDTVSTEYWNQWKSSQLSYLDLSFNNISGRLPESLSKPSFNFSVDLIDLSFNCFYGPIPAFPASIRFLDLSRNKFHGGISFLCQMYENFNKQGDFISKSWRDFEYLDLSYNSLIGELPDCLQSLIYLKVLNLGHNHLSGSIPPSVGCLGQLETLSLYNNRFSGELPLSLQNCTNLRVLDFGANKFFGNVPVWIGEYLTRLYVLSLRSNNFYGTIPQQICQLVTLQILDLSINNLHGKIPSCVNNFTTMVQQRFVSNKNIHHYQWSIEGGRSNYTELIDNSYIDHLMIVWQGRVNEFSSTMGLVKTIDLSSNNLTGQIPNEVTNLHGLLVLDLSNNALVGEIPRDIGQMAALLTLNLSRNMFSGEMPSSMSEMHSLNDLDVSYNNLSGRVPSSTQLQSFPPERFVGNVGLCGLPTAKKCLEDEDLGVPPVSDGEGDADELQNWFYIGGATGFATAFWIACSALLLNPRLRHAFFHLQNCLKDWVYVKVVVFIARLRRVANA